MDLNVERNKKQSKMADAEVDRFHRAIEKIDEDYMSQIWDAADTIEQELNALASKRPSLPVLL